MTFLLNISTNLPVLCVALKHHRVLRLADLAGIVILNLLDVLLGLDTVILGESALVSLLYGVSVMIALI